jgi:tRNA A-37 threonylcarbamoyl transferase component Bud32
LPDAAAPGATAARSANAATAAASAAPQLCPYADCGQTNAGNATRCVYCNRPLHDTAPNAHDTRPLPAALRDDYRTIDVFPATGSEADILLVELRATHERRVVKLYRRGLQPDMRMLALLSQSTGSTVVGVLAHGVSEGTAYEVLEYIPGGTLQHYLAAGPVPATDVRAIVRDVASALIGVHAHHILHRDVKPDNILLRSASPLRVALTDFGIASLSEATQHFTEGARTTRYAAPEVLTGVLDAKADWWSLGMIVLEAATGRHPFEGLTEQVMNHHLATRPIDVTGIYDDDLRRLARGLLLRDPKRRFGDDEVTRWLQGDPSLRAVDDVVEAGTAATPYMLDQRQCNTVDELARALAAEWDIGKRDLARGQVGRWIENELHDHNLARKLRDILEQRTGSADRKLLQFLLLVLPGVPPLWRGTPVTVDALLDHARNAVNGDDTSAQWLGSLRDEDILALFPTDAALAQQASAWKEAWQRYSDLWQQAQQDEMAWRRTPAGRPSSQAHIDNVLYGMQARLSPPPEYTVNAALLLAIAQPAYIDALRTELRAGAAALAGHVPWFDALWKKADGDPIGTLVTHHILPQARADAEQMEARRTSADKALDAAIEESRAQVRSRVTLLLQMLPDDDAIDRSQTQDIVDAVEPLLAVCQQALTHDLTDSRHGSLRANLDRLLVRGFALRSALANLELTEGISSIFREPQRLGLAAIMILLLLVTRNAWLISAGFVACVGVVYYLWYRRYAAQEKVIEALRHLRLPARLFLREPEAPPGAQS